MMKNREAEFVDMGRGTWGWGRWEVGKDEGKLQGFSMLVY